MVCRIHSSVALTAFLFIGASGTMVAQANGPSRSAARELYKRSAPLASQSMPLEQKQGFDITAWLGNNGTIGMGAFPDFDPPGGIGLEYPVGSGIEHLFGAGLWIGALVDTGTQGFSRHFHAVTTAYDWGQQGPRHEMFGGQTASDTFYQTSIFRTGVPNVRFVDDDNDGRIDEDDFDGIDNDHDGLIDEDYGAVSESDISVSYTDDFRDQVIAGHFPLGIKVWQKSYAWESHVLQPILPFEFYIVNIGTRVWDSVYVGYFVDPSVGPRSVPLSYTRKYCGYLSDVRTGYAHNAIDRPSTPVGVTVLGTPKPLDSLRYTFQWNDFQNNPGTDESHYQLMSSGFIKPDEPFSPGSDAQFLLSFGPLGTILPGETLKVAISVESGAGVEIGPNNMKDNALKALELYSRNYTTPPVPPSPPLRITPGNNSVLLDWKWRPGDPKFDPLETWDDSNKFVEALPDTHWRKRNPPSGKTHGGRIFEGFRIWRGEFPDFNPLGFTLLKQFDVNDDLHFEYQTGLQYSLVDSDLVRGKKYWYAVTSFSIPGASVVLIPDPNGNPPHLDTLVSESVESGLSENATLIQLPFLPSARLGEVKVVPNPYRTDRNYTAEGGGWEGLSRNWTENQRVIWFIHLPPKATIRVFSMAGNLVTTIHHDDGMRSTPGRPIGQEEWNLLSESGRAIASGVYVYAVESQFGQQIGKFVIIR
jgi:hypothetical protein